MPSGRCRPSALGMYQQAVVTVLNEIYEADFRGFSYGFRPGRNAHMALDALNAVPVKQPNKEGRPSAEAAEGRRQPKENDAQSNMHENRETSKASVDQADRPAKAQSHNAGVYAMEESDCRVCFSTCQGLRPRRVPLWLAILSPPRMLPSR